MSSVDEIGSITSKDVYISKTTEKSWKGAAKKCKEFGMNIFILKTASEKLMLLLIHESYEHGSEWIAITEAEKNCSQSNYMNENSLFFECEFVAMCHPYSFTSSSNIICQTGKNYLCEKIVDKKEIEDVTMTSLKKESTTQKSELKIINCHQTIHNETTYVTICDDNIELNIKIHQTHQIHNQMKTNDDPMARKINITKNLLSLEHIILLFLIIFTSFIILICCRRKCFKFYSNTDTTIILTN